jgi:peroxiredoxin
MHYKSMPALAVASMLFSFAIAHAATVGKDAPDFIGTDSLGQTRKLSDYRGEFVVLEWTNNGCPFTRKHYNSGDMQSLQKEWTAKGVVWLTVLSSGPGQQGHMTPSDENAYIAKVHANPTAAILDSNGTIGRLYGAKTTPHMFVIDPSGKLIYEGALDDRATLDPDDIKSSNNYVTNALAESMAGRPVTIASTRPYGCGVKYSNSSE